MVVAAGINTLKTLHAAVPQLVVTVHNLFFCFVEILCTCHGTIKISLVTIIASISEQIVQSAYIFFIGVASRQGGEQ